MCIAPNDTEICSGNGECKCGACQCTTNILGTFCEISSTKANVVCGFYEPCVRCLLEKKENCTGSGSLCSSHTDYELAFVNEIPTSNISCIVRITDDEDRVCEHRFTYKVDTFQKSHLDILINNCQFINKGAAGAIIAAITFFLGCFILVTIKGYHHMKDKREFARFENERKNQTTYTQYDSPLYNSPKRTYEVPPELFADERDMEMKSFN